MPPPATASAFLEVVRRSRQIDEDDLARFLRAKGERAGTTPRALAAQLIRENVITLFQAEQFLLGKYRGFTLGGYRVIERLGVGGAGVVYLAEHEAMKRQVAIKVLPAPAAGDPETLERFRREARAAARLNHPNILRVFDYRNDGLHFLVLEYVKGPNLQQLIERRGRLPVAVACDYARQIAFALDHAHANGVVHRDIKPANVLVETTGVVKVLDMGLARMALDEESVTKKFNSNAVMGTADFLAPEQALDLHEVDGRADLYGLGATLYALLTGRPPFPEGTIAQKLMWHQSRAPERVSRLRPDVPGELCDLVARLLAKQPEERPATASEVAVALGPWADDARERRPGQATLTEIHLETRPSTPQSFASSGRLLTEAAVDTRADSRDRVMRPLCVAAPPRPPAPRGRWRPMVLGGMVGAIVALAGVLAVSFLARG